MSNKLSTWHEGELFFQSKVGVVAQMAEFGRRVVRDYMPDQHREFYAQLPFIVAGSVDPEGDAWATFLEGRPGFMSSPAPSILQIDARRNDADPASRGMSTGAAVGLLGIEMHTRRRNRMNGVIAGTADGLRIEVEQSFGNCPRYIQLRDFSFDRDPGEPSTPVVEDMHELDPAARVMIETADAFFVASYVDRERRRQVDVSNRGGKPGFVRVAEDGVLTIPDFNGNLFFATLGNIRLNGKAGLTFVDFTSEDMLQMTGDAEVILDAPEIAAFQGAERLWTFRARRIVRRRNALALRWTSQDGGVSPASLMTGDWAQMAERLRANELSAKWRPFKVTHVVEESASIRSFHLEPGDGAGLLPHKPGQHLTVRSVPPGAGAPLTGTFTLSAAPSDGVYRISVKRDGALSRHLHDDIHVGDTIETRAPAGTFTIDAGVDRPAVLLAGGVGITPILAMLRHLVYEGLRRQRFRPTVVVQAARCKRDRAFDRELADLVAAGNGAVKLVRVLSDTSDAAIDVDYDAPGHIDMALLRHLLPADDYDVYLCGPVSFMQTLYDGLRAHDVADDRIHAEAFGPSSLKRDVQADAASPAGPAPSTRPVPVMFMTSMKEARWTPGSGTLLELAEARGLEPAFGCREGACGTCRTRLLKGSAAYVKQPSAAIAGDEVLICCAVPAQGSDDGSMQLAL